MGDSKKSYYENSLDKPEITYFIEYKDEGFPKIKTKEIFHKYDREFSSFEKAKEELPIFIKKQISTKKENILKYKNTINRLEKSTEELSEFLKLIEGN